MDINKQCSGIIPEKTPTVVIAASRAKMRIPIMTICRKVYEMKNSISQGSKNAF
jgi:hypothetical protein